MAKKAGHVLFPIIITHQERKQIQDEANRLNASASNLVRHRLGLDENLSLKKSREARQSDPKKLETTV
jgi:hypothetical protein